MGALLEVEAISRSFGGVQALAGAELRVEEGSVTGLIGPNGSGKTTLFNVITGYEKADAGVVRFGGTPITNWRPERIFARGVGRTFQLTRIFNRLTVLENMLVATQRRESWVRSMVRPTASAGERERGYELLDFVGLTRLADEPAGSLSFGQRKLLELAYILVADPALILLDEPAGGVNPSLVLQLAERVSALNAQGKTFLIVEHNMEFVMSLCHEVSVLSYGKLIMSGKPAEVRADPRVLDAYLGGDGEDEDDE